MNNGDTPLHIRPLVLWRGRQKRCAGFQTTLGSLEADGATQAEAEQAVLAQAAETLADLSSRRAIQPAPGAPRILLSRHAYGWQYAILLDGRSEPAIVSGFTTAEQAERAARLDLAQRLFSLDGEDGSAVIADGRDRRQYASWCAFQRRYVGLKVTGHSEADAHRLAGEQP